MNKIMKNKNMTQTNLRPLLDLHTHTVASGHAYSTLSEMVRAAQERGLRVLGITEHGPSIPGTCSTLYFRNMHIVPRQMGSLRLLMGCEMNILDTQGTLDVDDQLMDRMDIRIAGIHSICWTGGSREQNTEGVVRVIEHPKVHIISHPADGTAELDFEALVVAAKRAHTLLEVNNHSLAPIRGFTKARDNNLELLRLCRRHDVPVILGSDAHIIYQIAQYDRLEELIRETDFPAELIMNYWPEKCLEYLGIEVKS